MVHFIALYDIKSRHGKYKISVSLKRRLYFPRCVKQGFKILSKVLTLYVFLHYVGGTYEKDGMLINT